MKIVAIEKSNEFQFLDTQSYFEYIKTLKKDYRFEYCFYLKSAYKKRAIPFLCRQF